MTAKFLKDKKRIFYTYEKLYWGCIRPLYVEFCCLFLHDILKSRVNDITLELQKQYKRLQKGKDFSITSNARQIIYKKLYTFLLKKKKFLISKGYTVKVYKDKAYFGLKYSDTLFSINLKKTSNTGLAQLYTDDDANYIHEIELASPGIELYIGMICMQNRSSLYIIKDTIYEFDSVYMHERQHVAEDIYFKYAGKSRSNDYYIKVLEKTSTFYFNKYIHHPVELPANMQQLAYYLNMLKPRGCIDARRFFNTLQKLKTVKRPNSFKHSELNKYKVLFDIKAKKHTPHWYRFMFKLLNKKFYQLYGRSIISNISFFIKTL